MILKLPHLAIAAALVGIPAATWAFAPIQSAVISRATSKLQMAGDNSEAANQNMFGVASDAVTGAAFSLLHAFDDCGIEDSSKNLRVLWVRALLNQKEMINDEVAETLLPKSTRSLVTTDSGAKIFNPIIQFTEWIQARTDFIDSALDRYLKSPVCTGENGEALDCNVVMFGAGYDTRALRYRHRHDHKINFIEVDLPSVVEGKAKLYEKFRNENDPDWDLKNEGSNLVPFDLNTCGGNNPESLIKTLRQKGGLKKDVPTFFVWEAVLFYVDEDAVRNIMDELFAYAQEGGNGDEPNAETLLCFTDSLKPFVDVPFTNEANNFFTKNKMDLLEHRSRWGGSVHFALAASRGTKVVHEGAEKIDTGVNGRIGKFIADEVGGLVNSYIPTQSNNPDVLNKPSFDNAWYAIGYPWQIDGYENPVEASLNEGKINEKATKPFATRLWGEPLVIYRDDAGELVGLADACPHRSAPLSMGTVKDGNLVCFYHGWTFGEKGKCVDVPTLNAVEADENSSTRNDKFKAQVTKSNCGNNRAVVEHEGIVWMWRGNVLEADLSLLPSKRKGDMATVPIDTVLDYNVDYSYIVENNLDSPHLFYLHDGSVPPIQDIGLMNKNLPKLRLSAFKDDCGIGHLGKLGMNGRPKKLLRFDPPNIVRHGGVSGFEEEFHCIPIAPHRTRVLIRQHLPKGPILSTVTSIPYMKPFLTALVNSWNYHIGLEDAGVMQGQANRIEDWGAPRMTVGGLGDDLIKRYWSWREKAHLSLASKDGSIKTPYSTAFGNNGVKGPVGIASGTAFGDSLETVSRVRTESRLTNSPLVSDDGSVDPSTGQPIGSWGIKQNYLQETPAANFPPMNYKPYKNLLIFDDIVKTLFVGEEPSNTMVKTVLGDLNSKENLDKKAKGTEKSKGNFSVPSGGIVGKKFGNAVAATGAFTLADAIVGGSASRAAGSAMIRMLPDEAAASMHDSMLLATTLLHEAANSMDMMFKM